MRLPKLQDLPCNWSSPSLSAPSGLSNIIGIIVYISANSDDPSQSDNKKSYSYGWSFYFGALSFVLAEMVGVLAVHVFIEKHRQLRTKGRPSLLKPSLSRNSGYYRNRYQNRSRRYSYRSNHSGGDSASQSFRASLVRDREPSISAESKVFAGLPAPVTVGSEFMIYTIASPLKDNKIDMAVENLTTLAAHNNTEILSGNCAANRRTTPVWGDMGSQKVTLHEKGFCFVNTRMFSHFKTTKGTQRLTVKETVGEKRFFLQHFLNNSINPRDVQSRVMSTEQKHLCSLSQRTSGKII